MHVFIKKGLWDLQVVLYDYEVIYSLNHII